MSRIEEQSQIAKEPGVKKPRILIVDDDTDFISDMTIMLSPEFEVFSTVSTADAEEKWMECRPDCVLLDLQLPEHYGDNPDTEGFAFISHLRKKPATLTINKTPVIVVSAHANKAADQLAAELGIESIYRKPANIGKLKTTIWKSISN